MHPASEAEFFFVEAGEIVLRSVLHRVVLGEVSLQHDFARDFSTSGPSSDLGEQLKRPLGRAEVWHTESHICAHYAHERYPMNIVALGDHLSTDQQIKLAGVQRIQRAFKI